MLSKLFIILNISLLWSLTINFCNPNWLNNSLTLIGLELFSKCINFLLNINEKTVPWNELVKTKEALLIKFKNSTGL